MVSCSNIKKNWKNILISFIVIGRNEEKNLKRCFNSIVRTIEYTNITDSEIIYVDSNSTDKSINIALSYPNLKVIRLTDKYNAAIGRNIGVKESSGDILYFIDGDMEIIPTFLDCVLTDDFKLIYDFVSGVHIAVNYDSEGNFLGKKKYGKGNLNKDEYFSETGGVFMIKRNIWHSVNGMKNKFKKSQDIDLAMRLAKNGVLLLRKKEIMNKHHTIPYENKNRMWKTLFSTYLFYSNGLLIREHLFNKYLYRRLIKQNSTFIILILSLLGSLLFNTIFILGFYFLAVVFRSLMRKGNTIELIPFLVIKDLITFFSILLFFPKNLKTAEIKYEILP